MAAASHKESVGQLMTFSFYHTLSLGWSRLKGQRALFQLFGVWKFVLRGTLSSFPFFKNKSKKEKVTALIKKYGKIPYNHTPNESDIRSADQILVFWEGS